MISIILLSYHSKERIATAFSKVRSLMAEHGITFEFIVIDDGSGDESYNMALDLEKNHENVRAFQLCCFCRPECLQGGMCHFHPG